MPLLVLARNASHPLVHGAAQALDVRLPQLHSPDMAYGIEACWRHLRRMPAAEHYRSFLVFWAVCGLQALRGEACVIDAGDMARNVPHRQAVQAMLAAKLGQDIDLHARTSRLRLTVPRPRGSADKAFIWRPVVWISYWPIWPPARQHPRPSLSGYRLPLLLYCPEAGCSNSLRRWPSLPLGHCNRSGA